jgi:hypothetical protein
MGFFERRKGCFRTAPDLVARLLATSLFAGNDAAIWIRKQTAACYNPVTRFSVTQAVCIALLYRRYLLISRSPSDASGTKNIGELDQGETDMLDTLTGICLPLYLARALNKPMVPDAVSIFAISCARCFWNGFSQGHFLG